MSWSDGGARERWKQAPARLPFARGKARAVRESNTPQPHRSLQCETPLHSRRASSRDRSGRHSPPCAFRRTVARTPDAWPAGRDPDGAELLMMSELHLAAGRRGAASAVPPAAMRPARVATLVCVLTSSLPGVLAQTCVPAAPPAGYISDAAAPATATTVAALGTITCGTGYFSMSTPNGPACAADGNPFVWTGCDPCHTMAHVFEWGGGTCNCDVAFYGTASTDATGTTDCHPCLVNSGTAPPPPGVARTDNTNPSSCHCVEGYSIGDGNAQVPQHWERSCSVSAGETHRSRVNACKSAGPPLDSYAFSGTTAECSAAHSSCVFAMPDT